MAMISFACAPQGLVRASLVRAPAIRSPVAFPSRFTGANGGITSLCSSFAGMRITSPLQQRTSHVRGPLRTEANSKTCIACTKRGTRRRATRVSGFRARMQTPNGRRVLAARRKKGRKQLCTVHLYSKKAQ